MGAQSAWRREPSASGSRDPSHLQLGRGLEPATAKAVALSGAQANLPPTRRAIVWASAIKAVLASPVLALVWYSADPAIDLRLLLFTPLLCVAGFAITDLRVLFDLNDRHALAIWIKQGSLGGGLIILAALAGMGTPLPAAVATVARLALVVVLVRGDKNTRRHRAAHL